MLNEASRNSDGIILTAGASSEYVARTIRTLTKTSHGPKQRIVSLVLLSVSETSERARREVTPWLLATLMRPHREEYMLADRPELMEKMRVAKKAYAAGNMGKAAAHLSGEVVDTLSICGTVDECLDHTRRFMVGGVSDVVLMPVSFGPLCDRFFRKVLA
jgi:alkanesulfonate monooxygenase SsuD/methylene tetrahydromethanopterin reductase-like flavin-dependent oxidoreductase (luciferase family)